MRGMLRAAYIVCWTNIARRSNSEHMDVKAIHPNVLIDRQFRDASIDLAQG